MLQLAPLSKPLEVHENVDLQNLQDVYLQLSVSLEIKEKEILLVHRAPTPAVCIKSLDNSREGKSHPLKDQQPCKKITHAEAARCVRD